MIYRTTRPQELPELRAALLDHDKLWRALSEVGLLGAVSQTVLEHLDDETAPAGLVDLAVIGRNFNSPSGLRDSLRQATLWWVHDDWCDLLDAAAPSMPPVTLTPELVPDVHGFAALQRPINVRCVGDVGRAESLMELLGIDEGELRDRLQAEFARGAQVDFIHWMPVGIDDQMGISIVLWSLSPDDPKAPPIPLGRSSWLFGDLTDHRLPGLSQASHESMVEDRRILAALWQLASQPSITEVTEASPDRAARRRLARRGQRAAPVRVINLNRKRRRQAATAGSSREYSCSWIVRAHWRQQPYGTGRALRKAIMILPYIKGGDDRPLRLSDAVKVWAED